MRASIAAAPEGHRVQIELEAVPDPTQFLIASSAAFLLPALALVADALEPRQALQSWVAFMALFGAMQWIVAGVILRRMSRNLATTLGREQ